MLKISLIATLGFRLFCGREWKRLRSVLEDGHAGEVSSFADKSFLSMQETDDDDL